MYKAILLLIALCACSSNPTTESVDGTKWTLVQFIDSAGTSTGVTYAQGKKGDGYWMAFRQDTIYGSDNCNHFSGTYTIENDAFNTANLLSTLIGCPDNLAMTAALTTASRLEFIDSRLYIYTTHPALTTLIFEKIP